jgi:hypothetical protein
MIATIAIERRTDLTIGELCAQSQNTPEKIHANELGVIFVTDGCTDAESALINMLDSQDTGIRFIAYCQFARAQKDLSPRAQEQLAKFKDLPENQKIIEEAQKKLWLNIH